MSLPFFVQNSFLLVVVTSLLATRKCSHVPAVLKGTRRTLSQNGGEVWFCNVLGQVFLTSVLDLLTAFLNKFVGFLTDFIPSLLDQLVTFEFGDDAPPLFPFL